MINTEWVDVELQTRCLLQANSRAAAKTIQKKVSRTAGDGIISRVSPFTNNGVRTAYHKSTTNLHRQKPNISRQFFAKCHEIFRQYDLDHSGNISLKELGQIFDEAGIQISKSDLHAWLLRKQGDPQSIRMSEFVECCKQLRIDPFVLAAGAQHDAVGPQGTPYEAMLRSQSQSNRFSYAHAAMEAPHSESSTVVAGTMPAANTNPLGMRNSDIASHVRKANASLRATQSAPETLVDLSLAADAGGIGSGPVKEGEGGAAEGEAKQGDGGEGAPKKVKRRLHESAHARLTRTQLQKSVVASSSSFNVDTIEQRKAQVRATRERRQHLCKQSKDRVQAAQGLACSFGMIARHLAIEDSRRQRERAKQSKVQNTDDRKFQSKQRRGKLQHFHSRKEAQRLADFQRTKEENRLMMEQLKLEQTIEEDLVRQFKRPLAVDSATRLVDNLPTDADMAGLRAREKYDLKKKMATEAILDRSRKIGEYTRAKEERLPGAARGRTPLTTPTVVMEGAVLDPVDNGSQYEQQSQYGHEIMPPQTMPVYDGGYEQDGYGYAPPGDAYGGDAYGGDGLVDEYGNQYPQQQYQQQQYQQYQQPPPMPTAPPLSMVTEQADSPYLSVGNSVEYEVALKKPADRQLLNPSQRMVEERAMFTAAASHLASATPESPGGSAFAPTLRTPILAQRHFGTDPSVGLHPHHEHAEKQLSGKEQLARAMSEMERHLEARIQPDMCHGPQLMSGRMSSPSYSFDRSERQLAMRLDKETVGSYRIREQVEVNRQFIED
jgi:hypothetical protein